MLTFKDFYITLCIVECCIFAILLLIGKINPRPRKEEIIFMFIGMPLIAMPILLASVVTFFLWFSDRVQISDRAKSYKKKI